MSTINSIVKLEDIEPNAVSDSIKHLKEIEDLPYKNIQMNNTSDSAVELKIHYPLGIFDKGVSQFISVIFGELAFMKKFGKLTFVNLELPEEVYTWFGGPRFGIGGIKERFNLDEFPFLVGIIKPSLGAFLNMRIIEEKISSALRGGLHAVKDDEMQGNLTNTSLEHRVNLAAKLRKYIPTINVDTFEEYAVILTRTEIGMILINASIIGFPMLNVLAKRTKIPILSHVAMQGTYQYSFSPRIFALLHRLFGCDGYITPIGDAGYFRINKQEEREMVEELTKDLPIKKTLPLLTGGARLINLEEIISPYERMNIPYGVVFGTLIFSSGKPPEEMATLVVEKVKNIKTTLR